MIKTCVQAVDIFCGVGGLSYGLKQAGIEVLLGVDNDSNCRYPFEENIRARFLHESVVDVHSEQIGSMYDDSSIKLLAGCAPCQTFSIYNRCVCRDKSCKSSGHALGPERRAEAISPRSHI